MAVYITLKPNHPEGKMQRDGILVSYSHPVILDEVPKGMKNDGYFIKKTINKNDVPDLVTKGAIDMRVNSNANTSVETIHELSLQGNEQKPDQEKPKSKKVK